MNLFGIVGREGKEMEWDKKVLTVLLGRELNSKEISLVERAYNFDVDKAEENLEELADIQYEFTEMLEDASFERLRILENDESFKQMQERAKMVRQKLAPIFEKLLYRLP